MSDPHSYKFDVAPTIEGQKVDLGVVPLIHQCRLLVEGYTTILTGLRTTREKCLKVFSAYVSEAQAMQYLTALIKATAPRSLDRANAEAYSPFASHADTAASAVVKKVSVNGGTPDFPLPATNSELLENYARWDKQAIDYVTAFDEWLFLLELTPKDKASLAVQQALASLSTSLAALLCELMYAPSSALLPDLLHDDWLDGEPTTLTPDACNSLWDIVFLQCDGSEIDDANDLLFAALTVKSAHMGAEAAKRDGGLDFVAARRLAAAYLKGTKWYIATYPGSQESLELKRWEATFDAAAREGDPYKKLKAQYDGELYATKTRLGKIGFAFDAFTLVISAYSAYYGSSVDRKKFLAETTQVLASTWTTYQRVYCGAAGVAKLKVWEPWLGALGPPLSIYTGALTFCAERKKSNPNEIIIGQSALQVLGSSIALFGRALSLPASGTMAARAVGTFISAEALSACVLVGEGIVGCANIAATAALVADALWRFNAQLDTHRLKNATVVGVLRARIDYLKSTNHPTKDRTKLQDYFGISSQLSSMEEMLPTAEQGIIDAVVEYGSSVVYGTTKLSFFGLPAVFGYTGVHSGDLPDFTAFTEHINKKIDDELLAGNPDGSMSDSKDYARCRAILRSMGIDSEEAKQMLYWSSEQLEKIHADPMLSWAFWMADTF